MKTAYEPDTRMPDHRRENPPARPASRPGAAVAAKLKSAAAKRMSQALLAGLGMGLGLGAHAAGFSLAGQTLVNGATLSMEHVYNGGSCHGGNVSPQLVWRGAPAGTQSFAITMFDPDARNGHGWWHWIVVNIPANVHELSAGVGDAGGALPQGAVQARNDFGDAHFDGACPPAGDKPHRYQFTVWALNVSAVPVTPESSGAASRAALAAHALAKAGLTATFGR